MYDNRGNKRKPKISTKMNNIRKENQQQRQRSKSNSKSKSKIKPPTSSSHSTKYKYDNLNSPKTIEYSKGKFYQFNLVIQKFGNSISSFRENTSQTPNKNSLEQDINSHNNYIDEKRELIKHITNIETDNYHQRKTYNLNNDIWIKTENSDERNIKK